jgi:hypothetical protein
MTGDRRWPRNKQADVYAIRLAKEGDTGPLADRLRGDEDLLLELRQLAADLIEGKFKRPRGQQQKLTKLAERLCIAARVDELAKGDKKVNAVKRAAGEFGCTERAVWDAVDAVGQFWQEMKNKCGPDDKMPAEVCFRSLYEIAEAMNRRVRLAAKHK